MQNFFKIFFIPKFLLNYFFFIFKLFSFVFELSGVGSLVRWLCILACLASFLATAKTKHSTSTDCPSAAKRTKTAQRRRRRRFRRRLRRLRRCFGSNASDGLLRSLLSGSATLTHTHTDTHTSLLTVLWSVFQKQMQTEFWAASCQELSSSPSSPSSIAFGFVLGLRSITS